MEAKFVGQFHLNKFQTTCEMQMHSTTVGNAKYRLTLFP